MATKTLAEIYFQQGHFQEAYEIYKALAEKNPYDREIKNRLQELTDKLRPSTPLTYPLPRSKAEKIRLLERWLTHIRKRRGGQ